MFAAIKNNFIAILLIALAVSAGYIAFENHRHQNTVIKDQKDTIDKKDAEIKALNERLKKDSDFDKSSKDIETNHTTVEKQVVQSENAARKYVDKRTAEVEKKYEALSKSPENQKAKEIEISLERARGLWAIYCVSAPQESVCK